MKNVVFIIAKATLWSVPVNLIGIRRSFSRLTWRAWEQCTPRSLLNSGKSQRSATLDGYVVGYFSKNRGRRQSIPFMIRHALYVMSWR